MTGQTRTIQQPATTGPILAALGLAVAILVAAIAVAWGSANLGRTTQAAAAAPAAIYAPAVRDLGTRDQGAAARALALDTVRDTDSHASTDTLGRDHAGPGTSPSKAAPANGSNAGAPSSHHEGLRAQ
ncbi:MAG: hypothetical protein H0V73_03380 [Chloroflexi bacterium]|nr:hypothetical protein [Chloroflexota bacterium]